MNNQYWANRGRWAEHTRRGGMALTLEDRPARDTQQTRIDWMETGAEFIEQAGGQAAILAEVSALAWHPLPCKDVPFSQGYALGHLIKEVVKGKPTRIAWDGVLLNRYGLIGIEAEYPNGIYRHYWADTGTGLVPLLTAHVKEN